MNLIFDAKAAEAAIDYIFKNNPSTCASTKTDVGEMLFRLLKNISKPGVTIADLGGFKLKAIETPTGKYVSIYVYPHFGRSQFVNLDPNQ